METIENRINAIFDKYKAFGVNKEHIKLLLKEGVFIEKMEGYKTGEKVFYINNK